MTDIHNSSQPGLIRPWDSETFRPWNSAACSCVLYMHMMHGMVMYMQLITSCMYLATDERLGQTQTTIRCLTVTLTVWQFIGRSTRQLRNDWHRGTRFGTLHTTITRGIKCGSELDPRVKGQVTVAGLEKCLGVWCYSLSACLVIVQIIIPVCLNIWHFIKFARHSIIACRMKLAIRAQTAK